MPIKLVTYADKVSNLCQLGTAGQFGVPLGYIKRCSPMYEIFI